MTSPSGAALPPSAPLDLYDRADALARSIREKLDVQSVDVLCVLGSGLGGVVDALDGARSVAAEALDQMPVSTVSGHAGRVVAARFGDATVLVLQGRVHVYEGVPTWHATLPVRAAALLGARIALLTNSAGSTKRGFDAGTLMALSDHLNLAGANPLVGAHDSRLGARFVDMSAAYDPELRGLARSRAATLGISLQQGIYAWMLGPTYETPAEVQMAQRLGADAVGMSTVPEVIVARQHGLRVLAISCLTNLGAGLSPHALDHAEVKEMAERTAGSLGALIIDVLGHV